MDLKSLDFQALEESVHLKLKEAKDKSHLETLKKELLSKDGTIRSLFSQLRDIEPEKKPEIAEKLNILKSKIEDFVSSKEREIELQARGAKLSNEFLDFSLPSLYSGLGKFHPITLVEKKISEILKPFGFADILGPEIETDYYCFDSLNIPPHHPARDMQDSFYTVTGHVLRTHTTSVQARCLEKGGLPVKVASFGKVYRNESEDASHTSVFHQFELVWIEKGLTLSHLMALITHILKELYGKRRKVRYVPKFYPYTEPSIGPQINCAICNGSGCSSCGGSGWVTIAGAGMVHRKVLQEFKYNPDEVTGFAFGLGTGRLAAQLCGMPRLRMLYENDLRILKGSLR